MSETIQTSEPIKRGRPRTGTAMSGAEKMRALRQRARAALDDQGASLEGQSDTALLESLAIVYRQGQTDRAGALMAELNRRLLTRAGDQGEGKERSSASEETDAARAGGELVRAKSEPLTLAIDETAPVPVTVTKNKGSKPKPFYPPHVKARAVAMRAAGESHRAILAMIRAECEGNAPDGSNIGRLLKTWEPKIASNDT